MVDAFSRRQLVLALVAAVVGLAALVGVGLAVSHPVHCVAADRSCVLSRDRWTRDITLAEVVGLVPVVVVLGVCVHHAVRVAAHAFRPSASRDPHEVI